MMGDMTTHTLTLRARLDRVQTEEQALAAARTWADRAGAVLGMTSHHRDEPVLGVVGMLRDGAEPLEAIAAATSELVAVLAEHGFNVAGWEVVELLDAATARQRLEAAAIPPMVSAQELADMCGVRVQRIYQLESERQAAAEAGEQHALPRPVVPGYWLKSAAEHYAATRKRTPGPRPSRSNPLHQNSRAAADAS